MKIKITYPVYKKSKLSMRIKIFKIFRILLLLIAIICPIINIVLGGNPWSLIILIVIHICYGQWFYF